MIPVKIDLPNHTAGDTWDGLSIGPVLFNGAQPPAALQSCRLYFRDNKTKTLAHGYQSVVTEGFGMIDITDAASWSADITAQPLPLPAGVYDWDFETTDAAGITRTLYNGIFKVLQDSSHD